jgi:hypothetical protein
MPCTICRFSCTIRRQLRATSSFYDFSLAPALHVRTSCRAFCFLFSGTSSWSISACVARQAAAFGGRMGDGKRNKVKKSIWQLLCGCSSPQTTD